MEVEALQDFSLLPKFSFLILIVNVRLILPISMCAVLSKEQSFLTLSFDISKMGIIGVEYRSVELASLIQWA